MPKYNLRSTYAASGLGRDGGEWQLADSNSGAEICGEPGRTDATAAGADGEEVEVIVAGGRGFGPVVGLGADGESAEAAAVAEGMGGVGA